MVESGVRKDSESESYGKSGYLKSNSGEFVQVVIHSRDIEALTERFSYQTFVESLTSNDSIAYAIYIDENLKAIAHSDTEHIGIDLSDNVGAKTAIVSSMPYYSEYLYTPGNIRVYNVVVPVAIDGQPIGALNIGYSMENIHAAVERNNFRMYLSGLLLLGVVTFMLWRMQIKQIINPILQLREDIKDISLEHNIAYRLPMDQNDSFTHLRRMTNDILDTAHRHFKSMIENQEELIATNEELEATLGQLSANEQQLMGQYDEIKKQEGYIQFLADYDALTELQNRRKFTERLEEDLDNGIKGTVLLLDIDNFKNINDTLGHDYGDRVLKYVADLLKRVICENTSVYRFGGDEFLINIQHGTDFPEDTLYVREILDYFKSNHKIEETENYISVSTGIVRYPLDGSNVEDLLIKADIAMYSAKKAGKNQYAFFGEHMTSSFIEKVKMENMLRKVVADEDFLLLYQPVIDTFTGEIAYFEALIRIRGMNISPAIFIPIAEETRLILPIGRWVIKEAIGQLRRWIDKGHTPRPIAINLSPMQIKDITLVDFLVSELKEKNIHVSLIEVEITENVLLENREENIKTMRRLQDLGISIALDDFGTGYSSLNYLTYIPVNKIKLDKSLKDKFIYHENVQIIESLISLIHGLQLKVVTEGVEEIDEYKRLKKGGSDYLQGYLFSRPIPAQEVEKVFHNNYLNLLDKQSKA